MEKDEEEKEEEKEEDPAKHSNNPPAQFGEGGQIRPQSEPTVAETETYAGKRNEVIQSFD